MNTKTTITVVLLALALGLYVAVFETERFGLRGQTTRDREQARAQQARASGERLLADANLAADAVQRVGVRRGTRDELVYAATDRPGRWDQVEPVRFPAEPWAVPELIEQAAGLRYTRTVTLGESEYSLEEVGLDPPLGVVVFEGEGLAEPVRLVLGRRTAAGRAFAAIGEPEAGDTAYIVGDGLHDAAIGRSAEDRRRRELATFETGSAQRIHLVRDDGVEIEMHRDEGLWQLDRPSSGRANRQAVNDLIRVLNAGRISEFVQDRPSSLSAFGLAEPRAVLTIEVVENIQADAEQGLVERTRERKLAIGSTTDLGERAYFAMLDDEPVVFTLSRGVMDRLGVAADDMRDRRLTPVAREDAHAVVVRRAGEDAATEEASLDLVRESGSRTWHFAGEGPGYGVDRGQMNRLLDEIFRTQADAFADAAELDEPLLAEVTMQLRREGEVERLRIYGSAGDSRLYVVREGEAVAAVVDRVALGLVLGEPLDLRDRTVLSVPGEEVVSVTVERSGPRAATYEIHREAGVEPAEADVVDQHADAEEDADALQPVATGEWDIRGYDAERVDALFARLLPLRATGWIADDDAEDPAAGDDAEVITVTLTLTWGSQRFTVHPASGVGRYEGEPLAFYVEPALTAALVAELRETLVLPLDIERIASVEVDGRKTIERDRRGLFRLRLADGEPAVSLDESAAAQLWDTLAGLRAGYFLERDELPGAPQRTLHITTTRGQTHTLELYHDEVEGEGDVFARLDEQVMTLPPAAARMLFAPLTTGE